MSFTIPYTFTTQSGNVPVSEIDSNFTYTAQSQQQNLPNYALDTGTTNAYAATYSPVPSVVDGLGVWFKASTTNTGSCTFNMNGLGASTIFTAAAVTMSASVISTNQDVYVVWNSSLNSGAGGWMAPSLINPVTISTNIPGVVNVLNSQYYGGF